MTFWHESLLEVRDMLKQITTNPKNCPLLRAHAKISLWNTDRMIDIANMRNHISEMFRQRTK